APFVPPVATDAVKNARQAWPDEWYQIAMTLAAKHACDGIVTVSRIVHAHDAAPVRGTSSRHWQL
ncbi:MAG: hypothetical protein J0H51_12745, partial [Rhizobiales bacterium]|nr:hypothetical protein [Hyphomicrobiales bacterium]